MLLVALLLAGSITCHFDQWAKASNGYTRYTHMVCEDSKGFKSEWMRVPDHSPSDSASTKTIQEDTDTDSDADQSITTPSYSLTNSIGLNGQSTKFKPTGKIHK